MSRTCDIEVALQRKRVNQTRESQRSAVVSTPPRIPRISRLMALAIKLQDMLDRGEVRDFAKIARLGYVSRARVTQLMNLLLLAPDLQERLLFSTETENNGRTERALRSVASATDWEQQRLLWR